MINFKQPGSCGADCSAMIKTVGWLSLSPFLYCLLARKKKKKKKISCRTGESTRTSSPSCSIVSLYEEEAIYEQHSNVVGRIFLSLFFLLKKKKKKQLMEWRVRNNGKEIKYKKKEGKREMPPPQFIAAPAQPPPSPLPPNIQFTRGEKREPPPDKQKEWLTSLFEKKEKNRQLGDDCLFKWHSRTIRPDRTVVVNEEVRAPPMCCSLCPLCPLW